ncbi:IS30 family transposase [Patescibacteria group bacterium]|nr:IS30 family transposase [Patescibacteria group bacterium]
MRYTHFSRNDRNELSVLLKKGYSLRDIASVLEKNPSSVSREVNKNSVNGQYDPGKAHHKSYVKRKYSKYQSMKIRSNSKLENYIKEKMEKGWTPEEIAARLKTENNNQSVISFKLIYNWLDTPFGAPYKKYLASKQSKWRRRKVGKKVIIKNRTFIDARPAVINKRKRLKDFEADVLGSSKSEKERITGIVDRRARYLNLKKVSRLKEAVIAYNRMLKANNALSCTLDNGPENASHQQLRIPVYFCHPYSAWEKPTIENTFQRLRRFIPKKSRLSQYSDDDISIIVGKMNNTPRKCLNWKTPKEVFLNLPIEQTYESFEYSPLPFLSLECCTSG